MLKPVDLIVLAYLVTGPPEWTQNSVAHALGISQSNVHRALRQLRACQLLGPDHRPLVRPLRELLVHAVRHIYPAKLGPPARGVPTSHSAPMLSDMVRATDALVWPADFGTVMGTSIKPLHEGVPKVALENAQFHELLALIDVFRVGRVRERKAAELRLDTLLAVSA